MGMMPDVSGRWSRADVRAGWIDSTRSPLTRRGRGRVRGALYGFRFGADYGAGWMVAASCQMARRADD